MKNIAIYVHNSLDESSIKKIKQYYLDEDISSNVFIANDNVIENASIQETATINGSHINWMKGTVVFTKIEDFLRKKDQILGELVLVINKKDIVELTSKILEECKVLIVDTTKVRKIKNAELQHLK